jgi:chemotaxis response regulator CheB
VTIRILVVDDSAPWRRFVSTIAQKEPGWHVVGEVSDGLEAVQRAEELEPDVILLDIGLQNSMASKPLGKSARLLLTPKFYSCIASPTRAEKVSNRMTQHYCAIKHLASDTIVPLTA